MHQMGEEFPASVFGISLMVQTGTLGARKHNCTNVSSFNYVPSCFAHWKSLLQLEQVCEPLPFSALFYLILLFGALLFLSTFLQFCFNGE